MTNMVEILRDERDEAVAKIASLEADLQAAYAAIEISKKGLNEIASWREGAVVNTSFDEPGSAKTARETLKALAATPASCGEEIKAADDLFIAVQDHLKFDPGLYDSPLHKTWLKLDALRRKEAA